MFKFVLGLNYNLNFGLNFFIQPLNPEFRLITEKKDGFTFTTFKYYKYTTGNLAGYDSASVYVSEIKKRKTL